MVVNMMDYEVARERRQDFIRHAQEANRVRALTGGVRFGRTTRRIPFWKRMERLAIVIQRHVDTWMAGISGREQRRYVP